MSIFSQGSPAPLPDSPQAPRPALVPDQPAPAPRRRLIWLVLAAAGVAALIVGNRALQTTTSGGGPVAAFKTVAASQGPIVRTIRLTGSTEAKNFISLRAPVLRGSRSNFGRRYAGRGGSFNLTLQTLVDPGVRVRKGEVVATFDREAMAQRFDDYEASVAQDQASYQKMVADAALQRTQQTQSVKVAQADYDKAQLDLKTEPVLSAIQAELAKLSVSEAKATLNEVKSRVPYTEEGIDANLKVSDLELEQTRLEQKRAQANLDKMVIEAPINGIAVMEMTFRGGQFDRIKEGDNVRPGQPYMRIVDTSSMQVRALVNQVDADQLRIGQQATVSFDAYPGLRLPARVEAIGTLSQARSFRPEWIKQIPVVLSLDKMDPRVLPDLSVSVDVVLQSVPSQVIVPREAVTSAPQGGPSLFVKTPKGWQRREVDLGPENNIYVAVRSNLKPGETVALGVPPSEVDEPAGNTESD